MCPGSCSQNGRRVDDLLILHLLQCFVKSFENVIAGKDEETVSTVLSSVHTIAVNTFVLD